MTRRTFLRDLLHLCQTVAVVSVAEYVVGSALDLKDGKLVAGAKEWQVIGTTMDFGGYFDRCSCYPPFPASPCTYPGVMCAAGGGACAYNVPSTPNRNVLSCE